MWVKWPIWYALGRNPTNICSITGTICSQWFHSTYVRNLTRCLVNHYSRTTVHFNLPWTTCSITTLTTGTFQWWYDYVRRRYTDQRLYRWAGWRNHIHGWGSETIQVPEPNPNSYQLLWTSLKRCGRCDILAVCFRQPYRFFRQDPRYCLWC